VIEENPETTKFLVDSARLRWRLRRYFAAGEMARPPKLTGEIPTLTENWEWGGSKDWFVTTDAVLCGAWALPQDGKLVLLFANVSEAPVTAGISFDAGRYGFANESLTRRRMDGDEDNPGQSVKPVFAEEVTFAPLSVFAWEFTDLEGSLPAVVPPSVQAGRRRERPREP
jgi:hypothetical protein